MSRYGFVADDQVYLERCPKCDKENWAPAVAKGQCAWCGCEANGEDVEEENGE